jgi:hypothetical protein
MKLLRFLGSDFYFEIRVSGFGMRVSCFGFRDSGFVSREQGFRALGSGISCIGFRGFGFRVSGSEVPDFVFRVLVFMLRVLCSGF